MVATLLVDNRASAVLRFIAYGAHDTMTDPTPLIALAQMPGAASSGIGEAFSRSGPMALFVLGLLVFSSVVSWGIFLWKLLHLRRARSHSRKFLETFRASKRFSEVSAATARVASSPLVGVFQAGYAEIDGQIRALAEDSPAADRSRYRIRSLDGVERTLRRAVTAEVHLLTRGAAFLATTAAAAPFIGLFGTVWGIMRAFDDIGRTGSTSLVAVAPGIAEALVNTAAGLAAAIPALVAYNFLGGEFKRVRAQLEDFALEFLNLAERNFT
jgi:biopolymer transport protein TolQ